LTPNGKLDRQALPAPEAPPAAEAVAPPRDLVELQLVQIWEDLLGVRPIGVTQDFFALGGNSISVVRLLGRIFKIFGRRLTIARVVEGATIERLAALLRQAGDKRSSPCLVPLQPGGAKPPLFCVHPSGGGVLCYVELARCLGPGQPFYGLQAPAFAGEALEATDIESMASRYLKAVREVQPAGPYHLAGWSMGGTVAYEMACQLAAEGEEVRLLALLDSRVPDAAERQLAFDQKRLLVGMALELGLPLEALGRAASQVEDLDVDEQLPVLLEEARRLGLVPPDLDLDQIRHMLRLLEVNGQAVRRYVPRPYGGRVSLFRARDAMVSGTAADPSRGWRASVTGGLEIQEIRGDHFSLLGAPHVQDLAERLQRALGE
jgi:thioesterase domain-containing protein